MKHCRTLLVFPLVLLPWLVSGCAQHAYAPDYYYGSPYSGAPSDQTSQTPGPRSPAGARVVEKCVVSPGPPRTITHEVAPLETVWRIAKMYDVSPEAIYSANRIRPQDPLRVGQRLTIPNAKSLRHVIALYPNSQWKYIVIHHTATDVGKAFSIHQSHQDRGFWNGLGYHFLIDNGTLGKGDGQIEVAPRWIKQQCGAHCKAGGMNDKGIGIALVGNFNQEQPTPTQLQSLVYLLKTLCDYYHIPSSSIVGHRDVEGAATECPGRRFPWSSVRQCLASPDGSRSNAIVVKPGR